MFGALQSNAAKIATVTAAANTLLKDEVLEAFDAIMPLVRAAASQRHEFAHHLWGASDDIPDALLLVDPKHSLGWSVDVQEAITQTYKRSVRLGELNELAPLPEYPREQVMVWRSADLERYTKETSETGKLLNFLCLTADAHFPEVTVSLLLSKEPHFQSALSRLRLRRSKQEARSQSPDEGEK